MLFNQTCLQAFKFSETAFTKGRALSLKDPTPPQLYWPLLSPWSRQGFETSGILMLFEALMGAGRGWTTLNTMSFITVSLPQAPSFLIIFLFLFFLFLLSPTPHPETEASIPFSQFAHEIPMVSPCRCPLWGCVESAISESSLFPDYLLILPCSFLFLHLLLCFTTAHEYLWKALPLDHQEQRQWFPVPSHSAY